MSTSLRLLIPIRPFVSLYSSLLLRLSFFLSNSTKALKLKLSGTTTNEVLLACAIGLELAAYCSAESIIDYEDKSNKGQLLEIIAPTMQPNVMPQELSNNTGLPHIKHLCALTNSMVEQKYYQDLIISNRDFYCTTPSKLYKSSIKKKIIEAIRPGILMRKKRLKPLEFDLWLEVATKTNIEDKIATDLRESGNPQYGKWCAIGMAFPIQLPRPQDLVNATASGQIASPNTRSIMLQLVGQVAGLCSRYKDSLPLITQTLRANANATAGLEIPFVNNNQVSARMNFGVPQPFQENNGVRLVSPANNGDGAANQQATYQAPSANNNQVSHHVNLASLERPLSQPPQLGDPNAAYSQRSTTPQLFFQLPSNQAPAASTAQLVGGLTVGQQLVLSNIFLDQSAINQQVLPAQEGPGVVPNPSATNNQLPDMPPVAANNIDYSHAPVPTTTMHNPSAANIQRPAIPPQPSLQVDQFSTGVNMPDPNRLQTGPELCTVTGQLVLAPRLLPPDFQHSHQNQNPAPPHAGNNVPMNIEPRRLPPDFQHSQQNQNPDSRS